MKSPKVYIVLLNWNGCEDTIECLESLFRIGYDNFQVIVCDNASSDGSLERIKAWAEGREAPLVPASSPLRHLSSPPVPKPVRYVEYAGGVAPEGSAQDAAPLVLIQNGANIGFAAGNNTGIRWALARDDFEFLWLLNNDTVVDGDALAALVRAMQAKASAGFCGSLLLEYLEPDRVQAVGGSTYNKWIALPTNIARRSVKTDGVDVAAVERSMAYVIAASVLVRKSLLKEIGLMCEDYFLYFEELDWVRRSRRRYSLALAPDSYVYHKEGASIGTTDDCRSRSATSDFYIVRNKILFTRRFYPLALPVVMLSMLLVIYNRVRIRQPERLKTVLKAIASGLSAQTR